MAAAKRFPEAGPQFVIDKLALYLDAQMNAGILKPRLFGVTSDAQRLGVATVVQSSVDLFLGGMRG
jgi:hypothetical protein